MHFHSNQPLCGTQLGNEPVGLGNSTRKKSAGAFANLWKVPPCHEQPAYLDIAPPEQFPNCERTVKLNFSAGRGSTQGTGRGTPNGVSQSLNSRRARNQVLFALEPIPWKRLFWKTVEVLPNQFLEVQIWFLTDCFVGKQGFSRNCTYVCTFCNDITHGLFILQAQVMGDWWCATRFCWL